MQGAVEMEGGERERMSAYETKRGAEGEGGGGGGACVCVFSIVIILITQNTAL